MRPSERNEIEALRAEIAELRATIAELKPAKSAPVADPTAPIEVNRVDPVTGQVIYTGSLIPDPNSPLMRNPRTGRFDFGEAQDPRDYVTRQLERQAQAVAAHDAERQAQRDKAGRPGQIVLWDGLVRREGGAYAGQIVTERMVPTSEGAGALPVPSTMSASMPERFQPSQLKPHREEVATGQSADAVTDVDAEVRKLRQRDPVEQDRREAAADAQRLAQQRIAARREALRADAEIYNEPVSEG